MPPQKALEAIGKNLQSQYERWQVCRYCTHRIIQARAKYKLCLDPTVEEVKKVCTYLRRSAKVMLYSDTSDGQDERVLLHYNGHGVPRPTSSSEIWVFNENYSQYIPMALFELHSWIGKPWNVLD